MNKILVTGGAGFIGSNLIDELLRSGNEILCIDNFDSNYDKSIKLKNIEFALKDKNFRLVKGDIRNNNEVKKCFIELKPNIVIHLAAKVGVRPSIIYPEEYFSTNLLGTINILESMKEFNVNRLIFASSSSVYGNNKKIPFEETDYVDFPISPYAVTKKACELICHTFHKLYGFDIFCLRFFTVYGPRQRPDLAINVFAENILNDRPIELFGDGNTSRDYTFINDIVEGIKGSIQFLKGYEIINLGESRTISLNELIRTLEKQIGKKASIKLLPLQPGDVQTTYADITKAKNLINYNPVWEFNEGIREFIKWKTS